MRKDRRNRADVPGWLGSPGGRVKMFDKNLVHAIVGRKHLDCDPPELSVDLVLTRDHGSYSLPHDNSVPSAVWKCKKATTTL